MHKNAVAAKALPWTTMWEVAVLSGLMKRCFAAHGWSWAPFGKVWLFPTATASQCGPVKDV